MKKETEEDDLFLDDLVNVTQKKSVNSKSKGNRKELALVKLLNERFDSLFLKHPDWGKFSRSVGSGNRWGQKVSLPQFAKDTFTGDLVCPLNFRFVIESKGGYNNIDLCRFFSGSCKEIDSFIQQSLDDSKRCGKEPLIFWKKDRKPMLSFIKLKEIKDKDLPCIHFKYNDWVIMNAKDLLGFPDVYFFEEL